MIIKNYVGQIHLQNWILKNKKIAIDTETTGLNPRKDKIIGISLSNGRESFYILHLSWNGSELVEHMSKSAIVRLLQLLNGKDLIGFNLAFDIPFVKNYFGVDLTESIWSEVQLARHTADENSDAWESLKNCAVRILGPEANYEDQKLHADLASKGTDKSELYKADSDIIAEYAKKDTELTYWLNEYFLDDLRKQDLIKFYLEEEVMPLYKYVTIPMEQAGLTLDMDLLKTSQKEISEEISKLEHQIREAIKPHLEPFQRWYLTKEYPPKRSGDFAQKAAAFFDVLKKLPQTKTGNASLSEKAIKELPDCTFKRFITGQEYLTDDQVYAIQKLMHGDQDSFDLQSKHHWRRVFVDALGESPLSFTEKTKQPQIDENFLDSIKHKYEFVSQLIDYNKLNKIKSTYIDRFIEKSEDGKFYPRFIQHRTTSGRYSGDAQQLPRRKDETQLSALVLKYTNRIREFIMASPDRMLVGADYTSLEVVVFADDAGDESLLEMIRTDQDFYSRVAIDVHGLHEYSADKKASNFLKIHKPEARQGAKEWALGLRYGMGSFKLSKILGVSESEAKEISRKYFNAYPKLKQRMDFLTNFAKQNGFIRSKAGRIRHLPMLKKLHGIYGNLFDDSLKLYKKYGDNPSKYKDMKYLSKKYWGDINNALNNPIQGMAASIVNKASIEIAKEIKHQNLDAKIVLNIHDEICIDTAEKDVEKIKQIMQDKMENTTKLSVPLTAIPEVGRRYSELK